MKKSKYIILSIIFCTMILSLFLIFDERNEPSNLNSNNQQIHLNATSLSLNEPEDDYFSDFSNLKDYEITVPAGNIHITARPIVSTTIDINLTIASNSNFTDIIATSDKAAGQEERIDLNFNSQTKIFIRIQQISGSGSIEIMVFNDIPLLTDILTIGGIFALAALSIVITILSTRKVKNTIKEKNWQMDVDIPLSKVYNKILKYCTYISSLNVLRFEENKEIETELKQTAMGYHTTTHHSYSSSGGSRRYTTRTPYTYTIRYNSIIKFKEKDGKTNVMMHLNPGKMFMNTYIQVCIFAGTGIFISMLFNFFDLLEGLSFFVALIPLTISILMGGLLPYISKKSYQKTGEDQFNLLVKKPILQYNIDSKELANSIEYTKSKPESSEFPKISCKYCGAEIPKNAKICESCGSEL
ncbi:MAG: zinc-ribbon domain-containing protein [Candidatus Lokiarchaeota archaeon]|nr:zinc-ribbon domain-containing protein [Candidatus Lokiarchaeota archaeon]MBD3198995.1 zinc-ribbon domain-containing protein [Candidatus Lokiarchaeota archaeon]